jgi:hypothetical protein
MKRLMGGIACLLMLGGLAGAAAGDEARGRGPAVVDSASEGDGSAGWLAPTPLPNARRLRLGCRRRPAPPILVCRPSNTMQASRCQWTSSGASSCERQL